MKIAGRCFCGFALDLVARRPDDHLRCFGLRWCGKCGDAAAYREDCLPCQRKRSLASYRRLSTRPGYFLRKKEYERLRYRHDRAYAEHKRRDAKRRYADAAVAARKRAAAARRRLALRAGSTSMRANASKAA